MNSQDMLIKIKNQGLFTSGQSLEKYASDLCRRFARIHGEFIKHNDYDRIIQKLEEHGYMEESPALILH